MPGQLVRVQSKLTLFAMIATALGLIAVACGSDDGANTSETPGASLSGNILIDGSSTVFPITEAVAEEFRRDNPDVDITVGVSGTGGGFKRFVTGETDISNASRHIKDSEADDAESNGVQYHELSVAFDGLSVVVNAENDWVDCLTISELQMIWEPGSDLSNWNEIRPEFPDRRIRLYGPGTDSGTFDYFTEAVNGGSGASRPDYTASEDDNVLVQGIAGDEGALGYFGYAYYAENSDKLKVIGIDNGSGCVVPSPDTINDGTYAPLARPMFIYVNVDQLDIPRVKAFVEFYIENAAELSAEVGYVALPQDMYDDNLTLINGN